MPWYETLTVITSEWGLSPLEMRGQNRGSCMVSVGERFLLGSICDRSRIRHLILELDAGLNKDINIPTKREPGFFGDLGDKVCLGTDAYMCSAGTDEA